MLKDQKDKMLFKGKFRFFILALITLITIINYFDRSALSLAIGLLKKDFQLDNASFGVIAAAFGIGYWVTTIIGGFLADRFGAKIIWLYSAVIWSAATLLLGFAEGFWSLFILRTLLGLGEGTHFPAAQRAIANWFPQKERSRSFGVILMGVPSASLIGAPLLTAVIGAWGWRVMFFILGILGFLWFFLWLKIFKDHPKDSSYVSKKEALEIGHSSKRKAKFQIPWKALFSSPSLWSHHLAFFTLGYFIFFGIVWFPGYLQETFGLSLQEMGLYLMIPWGVAAVSVVLGGFFCDYRWKKTRSIRKSRSYIIAGCLLLVSLSLAPLPFIKTLGPAMFFLSLATAFAFFMNSSIFSVQADLLRPYAGIAQGINSSFFALAGIVSPAITGWISSYFGNFGGAFLLVVGLNFISFVIVLLFHHPDKYIERYSAFIE